MNFIRNRNFRAGPQTSLEGFICPQNSDKQQKIKVFGRSVGGQVYTKEDIVQKIIPCFLGHSFIDVNSWIKGEHAIRYGKETTALWRIMCDLDVIKRNKLKFDINLSLGEDTIFINNYFLYETSVGYLNECFYHLEQRPNGANLSSVMNANKRILDKTKLIFARLQIDKLAKERYKVHIHKYWEGTLVFSAIEMALRMSHNIEETKKENYKKYQDFMNIDVVKSSVHQFTPSFGIKALPFLLLKFLGIRIMFYLCSLIPRRYIKVIV